MVKLNVPKRQYTNAVTIPPLGEKIDIEPPKVEAPENNSKDTLEIDKPKTLIQSNTAEKQEPKEKETKPSSNIKTKEVTFPDISLDPIGFSSTDESQGTGSITIPHSTAKVWDEYMPISGVKRREDVGTHDEPSVSKKSFKDVKPSETKELTSNSGVHIVVHGDNATITVNGHSSSSGVDSTNKLPSLRDIKEATSLKELSELEERLMEALKYLEAKKLVLEMDSKIQ